MKKTLLNLLAIILAVSMVFTMAPLSMEHAYADDTTITIDGVIYTPNDDGTTATVSGHIDGLSGDVTIYSSVPLNDPQYTVTSIEPFAFNKCEGLTSITIPKDVTSVGNNAFTNCGLTSVTFADESNLKSIGERAFAGCKSLTSITIPKSVTSIEASAFLVDDDLTSVTFAEGSNLTSIGESAFNSCINLSTVTIPASVTSIGKKAFYDCESLKTITIPASVQTIESDAFTGTPLETVYYYGTRTQWTRIEGDGKPMNVAVYYIKVENNVVYTLNYLGPGTYGRATVSGHTDGLLEKENVRIEELVLSDNVYYSVRSIGENAFKDCSNLKTVTIPRDVTLIGKGAFDGTSLTTVNFQGTRPQWDRIEGAGKPDNVTVNCAPITIDHINYDCYNDGTAVVCGYITSLPAEVEIPSIVSRGRDYTVTSIRQDAFMNCDSLKSVSIPASVESIGQGAFDGSGVKTVTFEENSKLKNIGEAAFMACESLESVSIPASVESIEKAAFSDCEGLKTVVFEGNSKLKSIELNTFETCKSLESVSIPAGVESIGEGAFCACESLKSVSIPASVESIGKSAFSGCTSLESVSIPASVESIGESAFYYCIKLSFITLPASATSIDGLAFFRCENLTTFNYLGPKAQWEAIRDTLNENGKLIVRDGQDIIFKNSDGTELQYSSVKSGLTPQYLGETPTKDADDQYTYTFVGWDPEITKVTDAAIYTAKYDATRKPKPTKSISIKGANVVLSAAAFTYNGKVQKPAIVKIGSWKMAEGTDYTAAWSNASSKNVGTYSVAVTGKGKYKDTAKATYQIVPKGTTLKKPKKAKKAVTVKWKKQKAKMPKARISGYQIQLARNKAFTKKVKTVKVKGYKKTSKKVKKLKGKTKYYVRVRTYMKSGGNTYYSPWSKVKTVRTK